MNLYRVDLSTNRRVYLMPPMEVHGPYPMSMCQTSLKFGGGAEGVLFFLLEAMLAVIPGSRSNSVLILFTLSEPVLIFDRYLRRGSGLRYPIAC